MPLKFHIRIGEAVFTFEGEERLLDPALTAAAQFGRQFQSARTFEAKTGHAQEPRSHPPLAQFLKNTNARKNQTRTFLATAQWLHAQHKEYLTTSDVVDALKRNQQNVPSNPSQCLANNVKKGHCQRVNGGQFYVTDKGREALGLG